MKKIVIVLLIFSSLSVSGFSQFGKRMQQNKTNETKEATEETIIEAPAPAMTEEVKEVEEEKAKLKGRDRFMFNLTFDNLFHKENNGFKSQWHSRGIGFYYLYDFPIKGERISVAAGLGFRHASYYHNSNMVEDSTGTNFNPIEDFKDNDDFKQRKVAVNYFEIPIELRFFSKPFKNGNMIKAALGFRGGVRMTAARVEKNKENGYFKRFKTKNFRDLALFEGGPTFRIGYGGFNIIGYYSVTQLFKNNQGPEMRPFSIGISIIGL